MPKKSDDFSVANFHEKKNTLRFFFTFSAYRRHDRPSLTSENKVSSVFT